MTITRGQLNRVAFAVALPLGLAISGSLLLGDTGLDWFESLNSPVWALSLSGWVVVGILYYLMSGFILYRLVSPAVKMLSLVLFIGLMIGNELWNILFFGLQNLLWALVGMVAFAVFGGVVLMTLRQRDQLAARVFSVYAAWLIYDVFWISALWWMN